MPTLQLKRTFIGQLPHGVDLLDELTAIVKREDIRMGRLSAIGATMNATVAFYDQNTQTYNPLEFRGGMEILSLTGNISVRDGAPFVHAHIVLGDKEGKAFGGHLMKGTTVYALEVFIEEYEGDWLERKHDPLTGLYLWSGGKF